MATHALAVVCAWCKRLVTAAPLGTPVTHTICAACLDHAMTNAGIEGGLFPLDGVLPPEYFGDVVKH